MSVDGTYKITAETPMGSMETTLTLKTDGDELSGSMSAGRMGTIDFNGGKVEGSCFSFTTTLKKFFKKIEVCGRGNVEGDRISGEVITTMGNTCFSGVRVQLHKDEFDPKWMSHSPVPFAHDINVSKTPWMQHMVEWEIPDDLLDQVCIRPQTEYFVPEYVSFKSRVAFYTPP